MARHWICKLNGKRATGTRWERDFFAKPESKEELVWGNAKLARSDDDKTRYNKLAPGHIVFAYQTELKSLIGVLEITRVEVEEGSPATYYGRTIVQFPQPVPILQMKRVDKELECVHAFQMGMGRGSLHAAAASEVESLVHACVRNNGGRYLGIAPDEIRRGIDLGRTEEVETEGPSSDELDAKYGAEGESEEHRKLKAYVYANPDAVKSPASWTKHMEYALPSGKRADVVFISKDKSMATVVAVAGGDDADAGLDQAAAYRAELCEALGIDAGSPMVRAFLVGHQISKGLRILAKKGGVQCLMVRPERVG